MFQQILCNTYNELEQRITELELANKVQFVKQACTRNFGVSEFRDRLSRKFIQWQERGSSACGWKFDGIPYVVIGRRLLECSHGPSRNENFHEEIEDDHVYGKKRYTMIQMTKKLGCEAKIIIREILRFPAFKIHNNSRWMRSQAARQLKVYLAAYTDRASQELECEHVFFAALSNVHANHYIGPLSETSLKLDERMMERMKELAKGGVLQLHEMKRRLAEFLNLELFHESAQKPSKFDSRFWPSNKTILNCLYRTKVDARLADMDDSNLLANISQWQSDGCNDNFFVNAGDDDSSVIFVHQTKWQQKLLATYGNDIVSVDSTFNTTRYQLPLLIFAVSTSVGFYPVASAILPGENRKAISSVLEVLKKWNPKWKPKNFMSDFHQGQLSALEVNYPGSIVLLCDFHRIQAWRRRTTKVKCRKEILNLMEAVAKADTEDECSSALHDLYSNSNFQSSNLQTWFERKWLPHYKRWVKCYRTGILHTRVTTNNGIERLHQTLKYGHLANAASGTVTDLVKILSQNFLPDLERKYHQNNITCLNWIRQYNVAVPSFLRNRPRKFVAHCLRRLPPLVDQIRQENITLKQPGCFHVTSNGKSYEVNLHSMPTCHCPDWKVFYWPCKHILAILTTVDGYGWETLPNEYQHLPEFNLDPNLLENNDEVEYIVQSQFHLDSTRPVTDSALCNDEVEKIRTEIREVAEEIKTISYDMCDIDCLQTTHSKLTEILNSAQKDNVMLCFRRFRSRCCRRNAKTFGKRAALFRCTGSRKWKQKRKKYRLRLCVDTTAHG